MVRLPQDLQRKVSETIRRHRMIRPGEAILVAVSGGTDSVALLHILLALPETRTCRIGVAHLNHRLRGTASDADAAFVQSLCEKLDLPVFTSSIDCRNHGFGKGVSLEDAARRIRYAFLNRTAAANGYDRIALGHQADDNAEQVLLALFRGSGIHGAAGIPPIREGKIVRPLIRVQRSEILDFLRSNELSWVEDETNRAIVCRRNAVRIDILPLLKRTFSKAVPELLSRFAEIALDEDEWIETLLEPEYATIIRCIAPEEIRISAGALLSCHPALQRRILLKALTTLRHHRQALDFTHVEAIRALLERHESGSCHLPNHVSVLKIQDDIVLKRLPPCSGRHREPLRTAGYRHLLEQPISDGISSIRLSEIGLEIRAHMVDHSKDSEPFRRNHPNKVFFDARDLAFPLIVRSPLPGDRIRPFGMTGSRKVRKCLIDAKISRDRRALWPIVESDGHILWVCGLRRSAFFPVLKETHPVLCLSLHPMGPENRSLILRIP
uniref:tRNA(Ile)-lysidine synthase n=1 Tax=Desulfatirhabdium butyrativorans TaxID=340467 RepID=A0A7C4MT59_9BACT